MTTAAVSIALMLLKGAVVFGVSCILFLLLRRSSAATRALAWRIPCLLFLLTLAIPVVTPASWRASTRVVFPFDDLAAGTDAAGETQPSARQRTEAASTPEPATPAHRGAPARPAAPSTDGADWNVMALVVYVSGVILLLLPAVSALVRIGRLVRKAGAEDDPPQLDALRRDTTAAAGVTRNVRVLFADVNVPLTWDPVGCGPARILLPRAARDWSGADLRPVLLHELGHVARRDGVWHLLSQVIRATNWPNPLVHIARAAHEAVVERAADDRVLAAGVRPAAYARRLLDICVAARPAGVPALGAARGLHARVHALLNRNTDRKSPALRAKAALTALIASITLPLAALDQGGVDRATPPPAGADQDMVRARDRGLAWLAGNATPSGALTADVGFKFNHGYRRTAAGRPHPGVTALGVLAFLEAGHRPGKPPHGVFLERARNYLVSVQTEGYINDHGTRMKSHGWALVALARMHAKDPTDASKAAIETGIRTLVSSQNTAGGWRYAPFAQDTDLLSTVCQVRALLAAKDAGFTVPTACLKRARACIERHREPETAKRPGFGYQDRAARRTTFATSATGLWASLALGAPPNSLDDVLEQLIGTLDDRKNDGHYAWWFAHLNLSAALSLCKDESGRKHRSTWQKTIHPRILSRQRKDGSWNDTTGPGPAFATAVACLLASR